MAAIGFLPDRSTVRRPPMVLLSEDTARQPIETIMLPSIRTLTARHAKPRIPIRIATTTIRTITITGLPPQTGARTATLSIAVALEAEAGAEAVASAVATEAAEAAEAAVVVTDKLF